MFTIVTENDILVLIYRPYNPTSWIAEKFALNEAVQLEKVFELTSLNLAQIEAVGDEDSDIRFEIGKLENDYWCLHRQVLGITREVFIHSSYPITPKTFRSDTNLSIFRQIFTIIDEDLYVGGPNLKAIPEPVFQTLISRFPTNTELSHYIHAKISSVLKEYFTSAKDFQSRYEAYIEKKKNRQKSAAVTPSPNFGVRKFYKDNEIEKYSEINSILLGMLSDVDNYSEKDWQEAIIDILLILYPKYICVLQNVEIKDQYLNKFRYLDYLFVDTNGNADIVEIKKPFEDCLLRHTQYRDNYVPKTDLSGAVMQVEKYIYHMNKWGPQGEKILTTKYSTELPSGVEIRITNPKGIIIMGRSDSLDNQQLGDLEVIKRKYSNILDILTYDDLLSRVSRLLEYFKAI